MSMVKGGKQVSKVIVISLGGSIIAPDGVDFDFLNNFRRTIEAYLADAEERCDI